MILHVAPSTMRRYSGPGLIEMVPPPAPISTVCEASVLADPWRVSATGRPARRKPGLIAGRAMPWVEAAIDDALHLIVVGASAPPSL